MYKRQQEERRAELAEEQKNREILSSAPPKQESVPAAESEPQQEAQYAYHRGYTCLLYTSSSEDLMTSISPRFSVLLKLTVATCPATTVTPVSYTHLDVYKRQKRR